MHNPIRLRHQRVTAPKPPVQRLPVKTNARETAHTPAQGLVQRMQDKGSLTSHDIQVLQRTIGNHAVQRMLDEEQSPSIPPKGPDVSRPLPAEVRAKMEQSFGTSFANVRLHHGPQADAVGAHAYAQGSDIYLQRSINVNGYEGQKVLAHELAHVVQQRTGRVTGQRDGTPINDNPQFEAEAHQAANKAVNGAPAGMLAASAHVQRTSNEVIQRLPKFIKNLFGGGRSEEERQERRLRKQQRKQQRREQRRQRQEEKNAEKQRRRAQAERLRALEASGDPAVNQERYDNLLEVMRDLNIDF